MSFGFFNKGDKVHVFLSWPTLDTLTMQVLPIHVVNQNQVIYLTCHQPPIYLTGVILSKTLRNRRKDVYYVIKLDNPLHVNYVTFNLLQPITITNKLKNNINNTNIYGGFMSIVEIPEKLTSYDTGLDQDVIENKDKIKINFTNYLHYN